jgi:transcriptional regulator with XRE-family HTH domain
MAKRPLNIGQRARSAREHIGLTQSDVAERVGISLEVYGRFERGRITPRISTLLRICEVLAVEPNDLLLHDVKGRPRNESLPQQLRQLVAVLDRADDSTIRRVTEVARWLVAPRPGKRVAAKR